MPNAPMRRGAMVISPSLSIQDCFPCKSAMHSGRFVARKATMPDNRTNSPNAPVILVVDDTEANRKFLQAVLEGAGFAVIAADDGEQALSILRSRKVDAIVSDILM